MDALPEVCFPHNPTIRHLIDLLFYSQNVAVRHIHENHVQHRHWYPGKNPKSGWSSEESGDSEWLLRTVCQISRQIRQIQHRWLCNEKSKCCFVTGWYNFWNFSIRASIPSFDWSFRNKTATGTRTASKRIRWARSTCVFWESMRKVMSPSVWQRSAPTRITRTLCTMWWRVVAVRLAN